TSMGLGTPPKWQTGRRLAAALAFLGLEAMDRVQVGALGGRHLPPLRGRDGVHRVWSLLEELEPTGQSSSEDLVRGRWLRPGLGAGRRFLHASSSAALEAAMVAALRIGVVKRG